MTTLYDYAGRPIKISQLTKEIAAPTTMGVRSHWYTSVATGLTPETLAGIIAAVDDSNDILDYLTLAEEMEMRDLHYASVLSTRKNAVAGLEVMVEAVSDEDEDVELRDAVAEMVAEDPFHGLVLDSSDALGKGFSVVEIMWEFGARRRPREYKWRDPRSFQFDWQTGQELRQRDESDMANGIALEPGKFIVHKPRIKNGLPIRGGLARLAVVAYMCKGYGIKDWMAFAEVFGMPLRVGRHGTDATAEQKAALLNAIASIGTDAACIIPENMMIEFIESAKAAGGERLFEGLVEWLDKQVSKGVLGQVATTEGTPGRLGSDDAQHAVREDIKIADAAQISATLRRDLVKPFIDLNFGTREPGQYPKLRLVIEEPEDLKALSEALPEFIDRGLDVEKSVIRDKFGLPEPEEGADLLLPKDLASVPNPEPDDEKEPAKKPPTPEPAGDDVEETLHREQQKIAIDLMRAVRRGDTLTADQRTLLVTTVAAERQPTTVQSLILSKERFKSLDVAKKWVKEHDYHVTKVDETDSSYRFRQREPGDFKPKSFRTIKITDGVSAVIGKLKTETAAAQNPDDEDEIDRLVDEALGDWRKMMDPILQPIIEHAKASAGYEEFLAGLEETMAGVDSTLFAERLAVANFTARGLGDGTDDV